MTSFAMALDRVRQIRFGYSRGRAKWIYQVNDVIVFYHVTWNFLFLLFGMHG